MAVNWDEFSPVDGEGKQATDWSGFTPVEEKKNQDGALTRGAKNAWNFVKTGSALLTGDVEAAAQLAAERDAYRRANPGTKEGNELMQAWESGDGVMGGISNVAGEMAKDWREAPGVIAGIRETGKNLSAMGGGIVEQIPNMIAPMGGMLAGGAAGAASPIPGGMLLGGWAGATAGNTLVESGEQVDRALQAAGINPQDTEAVRNFIARNGDKILGQAGTKGAIIGAVDTATMGLGSKMLRQPVNAAIDRAIAKGINPLDDLAIQAAVKADPIFQASQKGMQALGRNAGVAALEPAGEFTGEYLGQGVATGDWDTKGATLEALSSLGQSAITFGGQKLYDAATSPLRKGDKAPAPDAAVPTNEQMNADNASLAGLQSTYLNSPNDMPQLGYTPSVIVPTNDGGTTQINRDDGVLSKAVVDTGIAANMISTGMPLRAFPDRMSAQADLDSRPDADRMTIVSHPRAQGRFAVVPKDRLTLNAQDEATARRQQLEQEDGNASQVDAAGRAGQGAVGAGGAGAASVGAGLGSGGVGNSAASILGGGANPSLGNAGLADTAVAAEAAQQELAPATAQPISSMPGIAARDQERIAQARLEAEARGARLVDEEAAAANTAPSEAQIAAGNYQKGHIKIGPLDISVENPIGSTRSGKEGKKSWKTTMQAHYGYIKRTLGADGDQVDVFIKAGTANDFNGPVFVVDQFNPKTGRFDEHKAMIGYRSQAEAAKAYDDHFGDKSGPKRRHAVVAMPMESFSKWAKEGDTTAPLSQAGKQADQAQAEIEQSTGKQSRQRATRQPGESQKDFDYRRAAEATAARQANRNTIAAEQTNEADQATLEQNIGDAEIVQGNELPEQSDTGGLSKQAAKSIELLAGLFRKRVVFFTGSEKADGFWISGNTIYINANSGVTPLRVLGHEMLHVMKAESPVAYNTMLKAVQKFLTDAELTAQFRDYFAKDSEMGSWSDQQIADWLSVPANKDMLTEEWMADLSGNRFGEADFWTSVFQKVEDQYGAEAAKGIINRLRLAIVKVINNLLAAIKGGTQFGVDARMADNLEEIRAALAEGFAQYAIETKRGVAGAQSDTAKFARGEANQTLPTRWPTAVGLTPSVNDNMITDLDTLKQDKTQFAKAVKAILEEPGMHSADVVEGSVDQQAEHVIERMKSNLLWLYDQVPEAIRERSKLWYDGARKIADAWSERYDITQSQAAGALAVLSPQKDWFMNVTMAERVLDILHTKMDHKFDQRMDAAAFGFLTKDSIKDDPEAKKNLNAFEAVKDKTLRQVAARHDIRQLSVWIRAYDEAYHDAKHAIVTPEGGFVEDKTTVKGDPTMRAWGDFTTPGKAASIYLNGSAENINKMLGKEHKVRNFYNNIFAPQDPRFTTIDTHAVAADLVRPLAGADKPVSENFGKTGGTNVTGLSGTYALHYEAYRRAAEERGVLPREMQSITWEAVRGLFTEGFKGKKDNLTAIDDIWRQVDSGTITVDQARKQIVEMAGGIENPDWWNEGNAEYKEVLRDKTYIQQRNPFQGAKVTFEVAPDPRNKEQKAKWDALSEDAKAEISHKVAWKIAAKALASFGDDNMKGELHQQLGGWLADTNPSLSIWFNKRASGNKIAEFTRIIGYALNQMAMTRTSPKPFDTGRVDAAGKKIKAQKMGAIQIKLNDGMSAADIHALYAELRTITGKRNKPYISGHSTADGVMVILHDDEKSGISTEDLTQRIGDRLFGRHEVQYDHMYADFPAKGKDSYGLRSQKGQDRGLGAEPSVRARADQLRAESGVLLDQLISEAEQSGKRSLARSNAASDGRDGAGAARDGQEVRGYGTAAPGAVSVQGIHYSAGERSNLDGRYYGTGARGAEGPRVAAAQDPRIKERVYFYVNSGKGITPEQGVGSIAHSAQLNNVYDANADTWLQAKVGRGVSGDAWMNAFESAVIDNGFDGYVADFGTQRAAVLLGRHSVPVSRSTGTGAVSRAKQAADPLAGRTLPAGRMTGAEWKKYIPEATMLEDGKSYYKDDVARAMAPKYSPARIEYAIQRDEDDEGTFIFARDTERKNVNGNPLDVGHLHVPDDAVGANGWRIGDIDVSKAMRRQGIATEMVKRMSDHLGSKPIGATSVFSEDGKAFFDATNPDIRYSPARLTDERIGVLMSKYAYTMDDARSKAYVAWVKPEDYLSATAPANERARLEAENAPLDQAKLRKEIQEIFLRGNVDEDFWRTDGHEGRHRMMALRDAGVTRVPVVFYARDGEKRQPIDRLFVLAQKWGETKAEKGFFATNLIPVNYENLDRIKAEFGGEADIKFSPPRFYSQLEHAVEQAPDRVFSTGAQVKLWLAGNKAKLGIKDDEIQWSGVNEFLDMMGKGKVSKDDVTNYLKQNGVKVEEVEKGLVGESYNENEPKLPKNSGLWVSEDDGFVVFDKDDSIVGRGATKEDAIADTYSGHPEYWEGASNTKYSQYVLPGGERYRELLLTLPGKATGSPAFEAMRKEALDIQQRAYEDGQRDMTPEEAARFAELRDRMAKDAPKPATPYRSNHWEEKNILAHVRFDERTDADGAKVLFIEEIQSDWGQAGVQARKAEVKRLIAQGMSKEEANAAVPQDFGFANDDAKRKLTEYESEMRKKYPLGKNDKRRTPEEIALGEKLHSAAIVLTPPAPFVTKTESWLGLAAKRMVAYAVENGYDKVAFVNGEQSADRYDLSKQVGAILYSKNMDGTYDIVANSIGGGRLMTEEGVTLSRIEDLVGKEIASKVESGAGEDGPNGRKILSGLDLQVGGEGMKAFYDKIVPQVVGDVLKKVGGPKMESVSLAQETGDVFHGKEKVATGIERSQYESEWGDGYRFVKTGEALQQPGFTITPAMREKVGQGMPLFSTRRIVGDSGRQYDQAQRDFFKGVGRDIEQKNLIERTLDALKNDFAKRMAIGIVDQFRGLRDLKDNGQAYLLARLSKGTAGAFDALLHHGKLSLKNGAYDADRTGGFVQRLGVPLNGELDDFLWWVAANRAEKLMPEDRERLFTPAHIAAGKTLANGTTTWDYTIQTGPAKGKVTRNRAEIYADANRVFQEFQKNALDMAEQSGLIDGASRKYWENEFYVPFYRVSEESGEFIGKSMGNALVRQQAFKKLKGGTDKLNSDLLSNTLLNFSHLIEASAKNRAAKASLEAAENMGVAHKAQPGEKKTVWFMDGGQKVEYKVDDPFVMTAITSLEYAGMNNGIMRPLSQFKHWLTIGVTASPAFKVRNLIRDSVQAIGTSELSYNPVKNVVQGFKQTDRASQEYVSALASGALIRFGTMLEGNESARTRQLIRKGVKDSTILNSEGKIQAFYDRFLEPALEAYNELGNRSEEINRAALYNQLIKQGKSHAEAALMARDLMDFSMQGSFNTVRFLTQVVPFLNARLQGLYKLGRSGKDYPRKMATVTGAAALISISLMLAYDDDDDWKRREDWDRDNYWWVKVGGTAYRIPKPFEIGAVATMAERSLEYMINDEMTGERFRHATANLVKNQLAMNPVPQAVKPIIDLYANKDSFTDRPIESMSMQRLDPEKRYSSSTSMTARGLSQAIGGALSPVQIDHLVRGYFSWLGSFVNGGADLAIRSMSDEPTRPALDYWKFATQGIVSEADGGSSRYISQVYDQATELEQAHATWRSLVKEGKTQEAAEYRQDNMDKLARYKQVEAVKKVEANFNERIRRIERSDLDPDQKKEQIKNINKLKEAAAKRIAPGV